MNNLNHQVLIQNRRLVDLGLVVDTFGNASGRIEDEFFIKPSGVNIEKVNKDSIVKVNINSLDFISGYKPSSDTPTHLELYKAFSGLGGIVHTHSIYATAWAQSGKPIPCLGTTHADYWSGEIPITRDLRQMK